MTICGNTSSLTPARPSTVSKPAPKPVAKLVPKPALKVLPKPAIKPVVMKSLPVAKILALRKISDLPMPKPRVVAKPKPVVKPKIIVKTPAKTVSVLSGSPASNSNANEAANFSPDDSSAAVSPSNNLSTGETATFFSDPKVHYRLGSVLGRSAQVRFSPIAANWKFGDGSTSNGSQATHVFSNGRFDVEVTITYSVSYRFAGQGPWLADPGQIEMPATVLVSVSDSGDQAVPAAPKNLTQLPYLVSANCLATLNAVGCF